MPIELRPSDIAETAAQTFGKWGETFQQIFSSEYEKERVREVNAGLVTLEETWQKQLEDYPTRGFEIQSEVKEGMMPAGIVAPQIKTLGQLQASDVLKDHHKAVKALEDHINRTVRNKRAREQMLQHLAAGAVQQQARLLGLWQRAAQSNALAGLQDLTTTVMANKTYNADIKIAMIKDRVDDMLSSGWINSDEAMTIMQNFSAAAKEQGAMDEARGLGEYGVNWLLTEEAQTKYGFTPEKATQLARDLKSQQDFAASLTRSEWEKQNDIAVLNYGNRLLKEEGPLLSESDILNHPYLKTDQKLNILAQRDRQIESLADETKKSIFTTMDAAIKLTNYEDARSILEEGIKSGRLSADDEDVKRAGYIISEQEKAARELALAKEEETRYKAGFGVRVATLEYKLLLETLTESDIAKLLSDYPTEEGQVKASHFREQLEQAREKAKLKAKAKITSPEMYIEHDRMISDPNTTERQTADWIRRNRRSNVSDLSQPAITDTLADSWLKSVSEDKRKALQEDASYKAGADWIDLFYKDALKLFEEREMTEETAQFRSDWVKTKQEYQSKHADYKDKMEYAQSLIKPRQLKLYESTTPLYQRWFGPRYKPPKEPERIAPGAKWDKIMTDTTGKRWGWKTGDTTWTALE